MASSFIDQAVAFAADRAGSLLKSANSGVKKAQKVLEVVQDPKKVMEEVRKRNIPFDSLLDVRKTDTAAKFPTGVEQDWRVKLSLPTIEPFASESRLLYPLHTTGGLVFPFTPAILMSHSAGYNALQPTHSNYPFQVYANSQVDQLVITGDFFVQNGHEAQYWVAALHYLRSITKMFYGGEGENQGAPPPIVYLSGYGDYVFNRVPVVITTFTIDLPDSVDYIATEVVTGTTAKQADKKTLPVTDTAKPYNTPEYASSQFYQQGSQKDARHGWAPAQSLFSVTCQPLYSRRALEAFSLERFVRGEYVSKKGGGFI
mgnify:CR=1 FL=1|jgi:hypothetical protein